MNSFFQEIKADIKYVAVIDRYVFYISIYNNCNLKIEQSFILL